MKKLVSFLIAGCALVGIAHAEAEKDAKPFAFSFEGPFGKFDQGQLQRGYKVYKEVCSGCHSMKYLSFRNLADKGGPGFEEEQVKALAKTFTITEDDGKGGKVKRPGAPFDAFPMPDPAVIAGLGAVPPDLSLITKAREGWHGTFNQLFNGIGGPQYVYSLLTGYEEAPKDLAKVEGKYFNPYFVNGPWISMPAAGTLTDGMVTYDDGKKATVDQMAQDVSAFLAWAAEPKMEERKQLGFQVIIYLLILSALMYFVKRKVWRDVH